MMAANTELSEVVVEANQRGRPQCPQIDSPRMQAMRQACASGDVAAARTILEEEDGDTTLLLQASAWEGNEEVIRILDDRVLNVDVTTGCEERRTPLHLAAWRGHAGVVTWLLGRKADVNARDAFDRTPLHYAALGGHAAVVSQLIDHKRPEVDVNARDRYEELSVTPLHLAAWMGQVEVVKILLAHPKVEPEALVALADGEQAESLDATTIASDPLWLVLLRRCSGGFAMIDPSPPSPPSPPKMWFDFEGRSGKLRIGKIGKQRVGSTALHLAAQEDRSGVVEQLLAYGLPGADFNKLDGVGLSALHYACAMNHLEVVKRLVQDKRINLNVAVAPEEEVRLPVKDPPWYEVHDTPLHLAVRFECVEVVHELCSQPEHMLLASKKNEQDETPLHLVWQQSRKHTATGDRDLAKRKRTPPAGDWDLAKRKRTPPAGNRDLAKRMENSLKMREDVRSYVEEFQQERQVIQNNANALLVGGALLASLTFGGILQMPNGLDPDEYSRANSPTRMLYNRVVDIFRGSNNLSFFCSILTVLAAIHMMLSMSSRNFIETEVLQLRQQIVVASLGLTTATAFALIAFSSGGLANIPLNTSGWSAVITSWRCGHPQIFLRSTMLATISFGVLLITPFILVPLVRDYWRLMRPYARRRTRGTPRGHVAPVLLVHFGIVFMSVAVFSITLGLGLKPQGLAQAPAPAPQPDTSC